MRWWALAAGTALVACASFGSTTTDAPDAGVEGTDASDATPAADAGDGGATCVDLCAAGDPNCRFDAFADGGCGDWKLSGDFPNVTGDCGGDALHIAADGTLDVTASLLLKTPQRPYGVHFAARVTLAAWDGDDVLSFQIGDATTNSIAITAEPTLSKQLAFRLCPSGSNGQPLCGEQVFVSTPGETHEIAFDLAATGVTFSVDCVERSTSIALSLLQAQDLAIRFGHVNGRPLDGTLGDVVVAWK